MVMPVNPQTAAQSDPGLFDKWRSWLGAPQNRAALLQTGMSLMQPVQPGQSQFGHIASSIGQGLGAAGRAESRIRGEQRDQAKLDRELSADALDRQIKQAGLELDTANTKSLIGQRNASVGIDQARLGLDKTKAGLETRKTEAEIANLEGKSGISLSDMFKASRDIAEVASTTGDSVENVAKNYLDAQGTLSSALGGQQRGPITGGNQPPSPAPSTTYPTVKSKAEFDALAPGSVFVAPDGSIRRKP